MICQMYRIDSTCALGLGTIAFLIGFFLVLPIVLLAKSQNTVLAWILVSVPIIVVVCTIINVTAR